MIGSFSFNFSSVYAQLTSFAKLEDFWSLFDTAFGSSYDFVTAASLRSQWQSQDFSLFPQIEVVNSGVLGSANGAYAISTNKIYLSDRFVSSASQQSLDAVILEEFGHFVDAQVNATDTLGDEGELFSALVQEKVLNVEQLQQLKVENDHSMIVIDAQVIEIEQAGLEFSGGEGGTTQLLQLEPLVEGQTEKNITLTFAYQHYLIPDQFEVRYTGQSLLNTGGLVSFGLLGKIVFKQVQGQDSLAVKTTAPIGGTGWDFAASTESPIVKFDGLVGDVIKLDLGKQKGNLKLKTLPDSSMGKLIDEKGKIASTGKEYKVLYYVPVVNGDFTSYGKTKQHPGVGQVTFDLEDQNEQYTTVQVNVTDGFSSTGGANLVKTGKENLDVYTQQQRLAYLGFPGRSGSPLVVNGIKGDYNTKWAKTLYDIAVNPANSGRGRVFDLLDNPKNFNAYINSPNAPKWNNLTSVEGVTFSGNRTFGMNTSGRFIERASTNFGKSLTSTGVTGKNGDGSGSSGRKSKTHDAGRSIDIDPYPNNKFFFKVRNVFVASPNGKIVVKDGNTYRAGNLNNPNDKANGLQYSELISQTNSVMVKAIANLIEYSQPKQDVQSIINAFSGASIIFYNDPRFLDTGIIKYSKPHYDHIHFGIPSPISSSSPQRLDSIQNKTEISSSGDSFQLPLTSTFVIASSILDSAVDLGTVDGTIQVTGNLNSSDTERYYRFTLGDIGGFDDNEEAYFITTRNVSLLLDNLSGDADVEIFQDFDGDGVRGDDDILLASTELGTSLDSLSLTNTPEGTYFIRIFPKVLGNSIDYRLSVTVPPLPIPTDNAGDTLTNAKNLGIISNNARQSDFIGQVDADDYYRFTLSSTNDLNIDVTNLSNGDLFVELGQDKNNDGILDFDEIVTTSDEEGATNEKISRTGLAAGDYVLHLGRNSGNTNYNLDLSATPSVIPNDKAGSTLAAAFNLGSLTTSIQKEFLGNVDPIDYYRFNLANPSGLTLNLSGLSTDIDLELSQDKDSDGLISSDEIIQVSELTENQDETIDIAALPAGNYFVKVSQYEGDTTYDLSLTPKTAVGADLQVTVTPITNPLTLGDTVSYTVAVKNIGASTATGVTLKDNFPLASVLDVSVKVSQGSGTISDTEVSVDIGTLNVDESATLIVSGRLIGSGPFSSLIEASSLDIDFNLDNDSVVQRYRVTPGIIPPADLELVLTSDKKTANLDEVVTLRMTLTNKGPGTATAIQVKSLLPQELTFVSSTPQQGSYDATTGIWDAGNIAKNNKAFVDIVAKVNSTAQTSVISEIIGVAESDPDSTPNNNNLTEDDQSQIVINNNITVIESIGNTKLVKNAEKYLFAQVGDNIPIPIMLPNDFSFLGGAITSNTKVQLYEGMSPSWNAIAAETVNGKNRVLLINTGTKSLSVLPFDGNWEWVLDLSESLWSWDSLAALNQENNFGVDANGDGAIGVPVTIASSVTLAVTPNNVTEDGTTNLVYTFTRTGPTANALTVNYNITGTATNGTDYATTTIGTSITFAANSATATLTVDPTTDTTIELDETAILTLATGTGYTIGTTTSVTGTITNDDLPAITLAVSPANVTEDSTTNLVYTFTRTGLIANALTVTYGITGTADSSDYTGTTPGTGKTITFAANSATATVTLDTTADTTIEPDETVILTLASEAGYTIGTTTPITGTITNDDVASYRDKLTTPIIRFQNTDKPGTYLFAGEQEAASIRQNYKGFKEEGLAFQVAVNKDDPLMQPFYRFQNTTKGREGTYLFADEKEAISIRQNYKNFVEEGLAFYAYSAGVGGGTTDFTRFQNKNAPGTYLFTGPSETSSVLTNFPGFTLEGSAFAAG